MKKIFTLLTALAMTVGAFATDYTDTLVVSVNGVSAAPMVTTISVTPNEDDTYHFALKDFTFMGINIGDIDMDNVPAAKQDGITYLSDTQNVTVNLGMPMSLPVTLRAELRDNETKMYASMDIDVVGLGQSVNVTFGGGYQIPNSGFENFYTNDVHQNVGGASVYIDEPLHWHGFASSTGNFSAFVNATPHTFVSTETRPGSAGSKSVCVKATQIFTVVANGTITTGRMKAGNMVAASTDNHAELDMSNTDKDGNGDPFYTELNGRPDSLAVWVSFNQGTANAAHPYATVSAIITDGTYYQDPEDKTYTNVVAKAQKTDIAATGEKTWERLSIPFKYEDNDVKAKAILVTISTNADPGQGSANDSILVDDISLVYNDPANVQVNWNDDKVSEAKTVAEDDIAVTYDNANGARVVKSLKQNGDNVDATVIVFNGDLTKKIDEEKHTYENATVTGVRAVRISDTKPGKAPAEYYTISGQRVSGMQPGNVYVVKSNGKAAKMICK